MQTKTMILAAAALAFAAGGAVAQSNMPDMGHDQMAGHMDSHGGMAGAHMTRAMSAFMAAMKKMDRDMMAARGATVDETFARKMRAHHQGAIDMAEIELEHGSDPQAKQLAQKTIEENRQGIRELDEFLRAHHH